MANDETAFFRFGTNADEIAQNITGAMARINAALDQGSNLDTGQLLTDTKRIGSSFQNIEGDLRQQVGKIRGLFDELRAGNLKPEEFQGRFQAAMSGALRNIPSVLASELALLPTTTAQRLPMSQIGREVAGHYADGLILAAREERAKVGDALKGMTRFDRRDFRTDIAMVGADPVAFGEERTRRQQLENIVRAENILMKDPGLGSETTQAMFASNPSLRRQIEDLQELAEEQGRLRFKETDDGYDMPVAFEPSTAREELKELNRERALGETVTRRLAKEEERLGREVERTAEKTREQRLAQETLEEGEYGARRFAGRLYGPDGDWLKPTTMGAAEEPNRIYQEQARLAKEKYEEEVENGRRLASRFTEVADVGSYAVLDRDVYRLNAHGAERIKNEYTIQKILERQDAEYARQILRAQRLAELDGKRALRGEQGRKGFLGGFLQRFHRGEQDVVTGLGGQVASAAAFTLAYGSLFGLQNAIRDTVTEFKDYQDSLVDLQVASRSTDVVTGAFVDRLGELARVSGANVGAALDTAARGMRAFGEETDSDARSQDIGEATNAAATKLSVIADKSLPDATGDLIAAGSAFNLMPDQLNQVVDAVANAKRTVGGDAAQISQGLALIAGGAQEAGYNLDEAAAVIGLVQARTDQSGQAIATRLTRIFQIIAGSTGKGLARELGVDATAPIKEQIERYAEIYSDPSTSQGVRDRIASGVGGTANLRELLPLLNENEKLQSAYAEALANTGQGTDEFNQKQENLVGVLKRITGTVKSIQVELADSGLFAPLGAAVRILEPFLHSLDRLLKGFNSLPEPIRIATGLVLDFLIAAKAVSVLMATNAAVGFGQAILSGVGLETAGNSKSGIALKAAAELEAAEALLIASRAREAQGITNASTQRAVAEANYNRAVVAATQARVAAEGASAAGAAAAGATGVRGRAVSAIAGGAAAGSLRFGAARVAGFAMSNPVLGIAALLGGGYAYNKLREGSDQKNSFQQSYSLAQQTFGRLDGSASKFDATVTDLNTAIGNLKKSSANFLSRGDKDEVVSDLEARKGVAEKIAAQVKAREEFNAQAQNISVFGTGAIETVADLANGLAALDAAGAGGITKVRLLKEALEATTEPSTTRSFAPEAFAGQLAQSLNTALGAAIPQEGLSFKSGARTNPDGSRTPVIAELAKNQSELLLGLTPQEVEQFYEEVLARAKAEGIKPGESISDAQVTEFVEFAVSQFDFGDVAEGAAKLKEDVFASLQQGMFDSLGAEKRDRKRLLNGKGTLTSDQLLSILNPNEDGSYKGLLAEFDGARQSVPSGDDGRIMETVLGTQARLMRSLASRYKGPGLDDLIEMAGKAESDYAEVRIENLERLRRAAQNEPGLSRRQVRRIGRDFLTKEIKTAAGAGDIQQVIDIMERASDAALKAVIDMLNAAAETARQAREKKQRILDLALENARKSPIGPYPVDIEGFYEIPEYRREKKARVANEARKVANVPKTGGVYDTGSDTANYEKPEEPDEPDKPEDIAAARARARAARIGGGLANATASLTAARAQLKAAKKGTVEYYDALAALFEAQTEMRNAVVSYRNTLGQLRGDITDPVENARDALRAAARQLRADRGRGKDVRAEDRLAVRQARTQLEAAKFSQRLSDVQTAEQLGKISHAKYIAYLDNEHDRLSRIKNRTRQQQDQLNEIDLAMKAARDAMDGQFNLGDINTSGLVYQVRRQAAEARAARAQAGLGAARGAMQQTVTISINGADTGKVRSILNDYLNVPPAQRRTIARRRV